MSIIKLGFNSAILPDLSLRDVFLFAEKNGFECVEFMCWPKGKAERRYAGVTHIDVSALSRSDMDQIKELTKTTGIEISALGYYPNILCPERDESLFYIEHLKKVISAAAQLSVPFVNTFIGRDWTKSLDENWKKFDEIWPEIISFAEDKEIIVCIENCPMLFSGDEWPGGKNMASSPAIWEEMFRRIPSRFFGLNYDPSHFVWQCMDYIEPLRIFTERIHHVHAKDVRVDKYKLNQVGILAAPLEYHSPKLPGLGDIDWGRFFSTLSDHGYRGPLCIEVEDRAYEDSLETRKLALTQSGKFLKNYIG